MGYFLRPSSVASGVSSKKGSGMGDLKPNGLEKGAAASKVLKRGLVGHQMVL